MEAGTMASTQQMICAKRNASMIFEFGDDEKNDKKLAEHQDKYFYLHYEVISIHSRPLTL